MEMGTGKSKVLIDDAGLLHASGKIDAALVTCPNSIKYEWEEQIGIHCGIPKYGVHVWPKWPQPSKIPASQFNWFIINVEALSTKRGAEAIKAVLDHYKGKVVWDIDESTTIKRHSSLRTKAIHRHRHRARFRRIATGSPVTKGPLDMYGQFKFLHESILGFTSYYAFRNQYAVMGGREVTFKFKGKETTQAVEIVGYKNLPELNKRVAAHSYRVLKKDCLDLPPRTFLKRQVTLNPEQKRLYKEMRDHMIARFRGKVVSASIILTQIMRLQQIVGGFLPLDEIDFQTGAWQRKMTPIEGANPKLAELELILDESENPGKTIIWAHFKHEVKAIYEMLCARYGEDKVVPFYGDISVEQRALNKKAFQHGKAEWFVGTQGSGKFGLTLTASDLAIYYSNSDDYEARKQSEERNYRSGSEIHDKVTVIDIIAPGTSDIKLLANLRRKKNLADVITGDTIEEWI